MLVIGVRISSQMIMDAACHPYTWIPFHRCSTRIPLSFPSCLPHIFTLKTLRCDLLMFYPPKPRPAACLAWLPRTLTPRAISGLVSFRSSSRRSLSPLSSTRLGAATASASSPSGTALPTRSKSAPTVLTSTSSLPRLMRLPKRSSRSATASRASRPSRSSGTGTSTPQPTTLDLVRRMGSSR